MTRTGAASQRRPARRNTTVATRSSIPTSSRSRSTRCRCSTTARRRATSRSWRTATARSSSTSRSAPAARTTSPPTSRTTTCASTRTTGHERRRPQGRWRIDRRRGRRRCGAARYGLLGLRGARRRSADLRGDGAARARRGVRRRPPGHDRGRARGRAREHRCGQRRGVRRDRPRRRRVGRRRGGARGGARSGTRSRWTPGPVRARGCRRGARGRPRAGALAARPRAVERERRRGGVRTRGRHRCRTHPLPHRRARRVPRRGAAPVHQRRTGGDARRRRNIRGRDRAEAACSRARRSERPRGGNRSDGGRRMSTVLESALLPTYPATRVTFVEGDGMWLFDDVGKRYLDFAAGIAVVGLGHRHPAASGAAHAQLDKLWHASNLYGTEPARLLARRLADRFGGAQAFFCNSSAEANEAALKYARKATGKPGVIALEQSFHGRTTGSLSVTGQPAKRAAFEPLMPGARFARPNDIESLHAAASDDVGLVLVEPVLGEGGVIPLEPEFLAAAAALAEKLGARLAFDEVQTGMGRTGSFFAFEQLGVRPQLVTLAKALANGLPIGCLLVADDAGGAFQPGDHGSTFGGNPVICAAGVAVCDAIDDALLEQVRANGERLRAGLALLPGVVEVRGAGLLVGAELDGPAQPVIDAALDAGLVCLSSGPNVLRLAPPLVVTADDVDRAIEILVQVTAR